MSSIVDSRQARFATIKYVARKGRERRRAAPRSAAPRSAAPSGLNADLTDGRSLKSGLARGTQYNCPALC